MFFKLLLRKIRKHKAYFLINILGLTVGFTAFILIALFIRYELTWDKYNEHYSTIYRVQRYLANTLYSNRTNVSPHTPPLTAQLIEGNFPEFEQVSVIRKNGSAFLGSDEQHMVHDKAGIFADSCLFNVFTYQFVDGNPKAALNQPYQVVLSEMMAKKLFGTTKAVGKTVVLEKKYPMTVMGVYVDLPYNSSLRPSYIISFSTLKPLQHIERSSIWAGDCMTYVRLAPDANSKTAEKKIAHLFRDYDQFKNQDLQLCPLSDVYLNFNGSNDYLVVLKLFGLIGLFIMVMSGFNYVNLSMAQSTLLGKEVAVKKVVGSVRRMLVTEMLGETLLLSMMALCTSLILALMLLPVFNDMVDKHIVFDVISDWGFVCFLLAIAAATGVLSGIYPSFSLVTKKITVLFNTSFVSQQTKGLKLQQSLIILQFAISLFLIVLTASFSLQIRYLTQKEVGFDKGNLLYTEINVSDSRINYYQLRDRLLQHPEIQDVCMSKNFPFISQGGGMTNWEGNDPNEKIVCRFNRVSYNYLSFLKANLIAGRDFAIDFKGDLGNTCVINEAAAKCFGWENPIGKHIKDNTLTIIGVVNDFIYHDMHNPVEPGVFVLAANKIAGNWIFAFRTGSGSQKQISAIIKDELEAIFPTDPFEIKNFAFAFNYEKSFRIYRAVDKTLMFFTLLNVLLAILGMYGLVSFALTRRTKEIGIRKINGSSLKEIFYLLNKQYYIFLLYAMAIAFPSAWFIYAKLPSAHKLPAQPWVFVFGATLLLMIIHISTSWQIYKAATRNSVDALRYE